MKKVALYMRVGNKDQVGLTEEQGKESMEQFPHLLETTTVQCTQKTYMIHPTYSFSDLTDEEKEIVYRSGLEWCDVHKGMFDDLYAQVMEDFKTLKEFGLSSEEGKEIIARWTD